MGKFHLKFPDVLTEEEFALLEKYKLLKQMKQALEAPKATKPANPTKENVISPKDAKERAKMLVKSGEVALNKGGSEKAAFKRPITLERKVAKHPRSEFS